MTAATPETIIQLRTYAVMPSELSKRERGALRRLADLGHFRLPAKDRAALNRLISPLEEASTNWGARDASASARNLVLTETHRQQRTCWAWDERTWVDLVCSGRSAAKRGRFELVAFGYLLGGHRRLPHRVGIINLTQLADLVFGPGAVAPAIEEVQARLRARNFSENTLGVVNALVDLLLTCGSPHLGDVTEQQLNDLADEYRTDRRVRRQGLFKISRVLADNGIITAPLSNNRNQFGPKPDTLATVPDPWLEWVQRWRTIATYEPATLRSMFSVLLVAGRWAAAKHPEALSPDQWTRDIAAEYIADTLQATVGQWGGSNRTRVRYGEPMSVSGMANRIDSLRAFFCDLIEWEWIHPRFDPRR
jgi:hypothetical protein